MTTAELILKTEALIFASDKPLATLDILDLLNSQPGDEQEAVSLDMLESALEGIVEKYSTEHYPFEMRQSGGGWQFLTKAEYHSTVGLLQKDKFLKKLSAASLETLAIIAYRQPVTKGEIEAIRGVNCDYAVQKLLEKELIIISGRNEKAPGQPLLYATSRIFMDYFGINSAGDLPKLTEIAPDVTEPSAPGRPVPGGESEPENPEALSVTEAGELIGKIPEH